MSLLPYFQMFLNFILDDFFIGLWIAGICFAALVLLFRILFKKRWFRV